MSRRHFHRPLVGLAVVVGVISGAVASVTSPTRSTAQDASAAQCPTTVVSDPDLLWTDVTPPNAKDGIGHYTDMAFLDGQRGWVVGQGEIAFTRNGGLVWQNPLPSNMFDHEGKQVSAGVYAAGLWRQVRFVDEMNGWIIGSGLFRTTDGGVTWREEKLPSMAPNDYPELKNEAIRTLAVSAVKDPPGRPPGTVLVWVSAEATTRKSDGTEERLPDHNLKSDRGFLFYKETKTGTTDGSWGVIDPQGPDGKSALVGDGLKFFDADNGLATTRVYKGDGVTKLEDGAIFATTNGGKTWTLDLVNPDANVNPSNGSIGGFQELSFVDRTHGSALWYNNDAFTKNWGANSNSIGGREWKDHTKGDHGDCLTNRVTTGLADGRNCGPPNAPPREPGCNRLVGAPDTGNVSRTTDGGLKWKPSINPDPTPIAYTRHTASSYPTPTVTYIGGKQGGKRRIFKGSITFVKVTGLSLDPPTTPDIASVGVARRR